MERFRTIAWSTNKAHMSGLVLQKRAAIKLSMLSSRGKRSPEKERSRQTTRPPVQGGGQHAPKVHDFRNHSRSRHRPLLELVETSNLIHCSFPRLLHFKGRTGESRGGEAVLRSQISELAYETLCYCASEGRPVAGLIRRGPI